MSPTCAGPLRPALAAAPRPKSSTAASGFPSSFDSRSPIRNTPEAIGQLLLTAPSGRESAAVAGRDGRVVEGPELINHENGERMVIVQSNVRGRDLGGFAADVQREVGRRVTLPEGYFVAYSGQFENQQRAMRRLSLIVPAVLFVIMGFLYASFGNAAAGRAGHVERAVCARRRRCGALAARAESQSQRVDRVHRALRRGGAERRRVAGVHQSTS